MATFLDAGAEVNTRDQNGRTPLYVAAGWSKSPEMVGMLLDAGADPNANSGGWTPLYVAARWSHFPTVVTTLLNAGANPKARGEDGKSPWDPIQKNDALISTNAYWQLNDAHF